MKATIVEGNIIDILKKDIYWGTVEINQTKIEKITRKADVLRGAPYILPGFNDSHVNV